MTAPLILIPARHASSRFPAKMLAPLAGRPLIEYSWQAAVKATGNPEQVVVATDHEAIAEVVRAFGGQVVITDPECRNGTERVAQALDRLNLSPDFVINFQGDAPLTPAWFVEALSKAMENPDTAVATPVLQTSPAAYQTFLEDAATGKPGATTAVFDKQGKALYFSKRVLPFVPVGVAPKVYHHVGLYAYRPSALAAYLAEGPTELEQFEGLEQLRFLYAGVPVACVEVEARGFEFWEVNKPEDVPRIEALLRERGDPNGL